MANYVAIELKTDFEGKFTVSTFKKETRDEAEKAYHSILSGAATSETLVHGATILNEEGKVLKTECYKHTPPQPKPDPEPEPTPDLDPDPEPTPEPEPEPEDNTNEETESNEGGNE